MDAVIAQDGLPIKLIEEILAVVFTPKSTPIKQVELELEV